MNQPFDTGYTTQTSPLRRSPNPVQAVLEAGLIATWFWDVVQDKLFADVNLLSLLGMDVQAGSAGLPLQTFINAIHPEDRERVIDLIERTQRTGQTFEVECRLVTTRAELRWVFARGQFAYNPAGQPITFSGVLIDRTEHQRTESEQQLAQEQTVKQTETGLKQRLIEQTQTLEQQATELRQINTELKRSNESLQQFAHIASHDLQEPLRRIQSFSDLLQNQFADNLSDGERDMMQRIQKSAQRMQLLIKDLLTYSQLSRQHESFARVPLTDVLDDVITDLELAITEKQATVNIDALPGVEGNASRLRQLFQNLIANALKFVAAGVLPIIQISARPASPDELPDGLQNQPDELFWLIAVTDNGIGFDEQYKDRIFSPFQRLHSSSSYSGTGIGLAICQRVAQNHGGAIDVNSQVGKGTTFKVFLPVMPA